MTDGGRPARADPSAWIAQEAVALSTHPTVVEGLFD